MRKVERDTREGTGVDSDKHLFLISERRREQDNESLSEIQEHLKTEHPKFTN